jgi:hypothetical protein
MPDLVFGNFSDLKLVPVDSGLVTPDTYHPPFSIDVLLPHVDNNLNSEIRYLIYATGNYTLLYNILSTHGWSSVYETTSVDTAVASLNAAVHGAMEQAIPRGYNCKSKFPPWFTHTLIHYSTKKKYSHRRLKRNLLITFMTDSLFTENLLKAPSSPTGLAG